MHIPMPEFAANPLLWNRPRLRFLSDAAPGAAGDDDLVEGPDEPDESTEPEEDGEPDPEGAEALQDPGKRALQAMKDRLRAARAENRQLRAAQQPTAPADDPDAIRSQIRTEERQRSNARLVRAEVRAVAAEKFADPVDALSFLNVDDFEVSDDGDVNGDDIADALDELLEKKPYLGKDFAAQRGSKKRVPQVPADPANRQRSPVTLDEKIAAAQAKGDVAQVISLQNQKLAAQ